MHTEDDIDPLDTERLDLKPTKKPRGFYSDKIVDNNCYIKIPLELLKQFDSVEEIHGALIKYIETRNG